MHNSSVGALPDGVQFDVSNALAPSTAIQALVHSSPASTAAQSVVAQAVPSPLYEPPRATHESSVRSFICHHHGLIFFI